MNGTRILIVLASVHLIVSAAFAAELANPIDCQIRCGLSGRYQFPNGFLRIGLDPQDVLRCPLPTELPAGDYDLYLRVTHDKSGSETRIIELGLADALVPAVYENPGGPVWIGPLRFHTTYSTDTIDLRGRQGVMIDCFWLVPADTTFPEERGKALPGLKQENWQTLWLDWPQAHKHPVWVTPDMPVPIRVRAAASPPVTGDAKIHTVILDYDHHEVGAYDFTFPMGDPNVRQRMETIPVPKTFGPYLLRFIVTLPDGSEHEFQRIVSRVGAPLVPEPNDLLGGHGNLPLLRFIGARWNRKWDSGGTNLLWRTVQPEENGEFRLHYTPAPPPVKELVVLERSPDWAGGKENYEDLWLNYVRAVVSHYRRQFPVYEIFNEPYGKPTDEFAKTQVAKVKATAKVIREADPDALITSGGPPEEIPPGLGWWEKLAQAGLLEPLDMISVHLYFGGGGTHPIDMDLRFDAYATALRKICDEHGGKGKPLWDTESGLCPMESFYVGRNVAYGSWGGKGFTRRAPVPYRIGAVMAARYLMLHVWHHIRWCYYQCCMSYGNSWALVDFDETPTAAAVALAQVNRLLADATPDGKPELHEGLWGLRFKKGADAIAAVWAVNQKLGEKRFAKCPRIESVRTLDMFCNPVILSDEFELGAEPILFIGPRADVEAALAGITFRSEIDEHAAPEKVTSRLTAPDLKKPANLTASSIAEGGDLNVVRNGSTVGAGTPKDSWVSQPAGREHTLEYQWDEPQTIHRLLCAWPPGELPDQYKIEWHDGLKWHPSSGTPDGRRPGLPVENYTINEVKTKRLRMIIRTRENKSAKVVEFDAFHVPRLTPPITEMQEIWMRDFAPSSEGFIRDWLVCGPFPSPGLRWSQEKTPAGWDTDFLDVNWIYGHGRGEPVISPRVDQEHFAFFPPGTEAKWKPMDVRVAWQPVHAKNDLLDLARSFANGVLVDPPGIVEQCIGYAACYLDVPADLDVTLSVGSDDGYRIWIDDKVVAENVIFRSAVKDQEQYPLTLKKGRHRILVKLHNDLGGHELYLRFLDKEGKAVTGYTVRLAP